ncbi:MAG: hypothetical protein KJ676_11820 [Alphaproteobacteria bacterium]|nr:hypothetical protein [Alphaproteobacteria bacterium]MBU1525972.1 hypothetical protein [Alphaproteobacteria bacterium]MBU2118373.1 hypothetical protein [Alphaproteobacteria bacterium]MBU2350380.1 hypothetical protein [Alphaproteobacteria bacterium]MBU2381614.1 hypothetical protein [Alphaproteobacteria bacterium]
MNETGDQPPFTYRMSGLTVDSEVALPLRSQRPTGSAQADVTIHVEPVPDHLDEVLHSGANWEIDQTRFLLNLPGIGRFMATDGRRLSICPASDMPVDDVLIFALGTGMSAILYQRGALLLHASAVVRDGRAYLFCGPSGAGKSTLSAALSRSGCGFLSDDLSAVIQPEGGPARVVPDGRALRLFADSIDRLDLRDAVGPRVRRLVDKFHVAPPAVGDAGSGVPIAAIHMLTYANEERAPAIERLPPLNAAQALLRQSYRRQVALAYADRSGLAARIAALVSTTGVYHLSRPRDLDRLDATIQALARHWDGPGPE